MNLTKDVMFDENNFIVSMVVYEDEFEESTDLITAPQVVDGHSINYIIIFIQTIIIINKWKE